MHENDFLFVVLNLIHFLGSVAIINMAISDYIAVYLLHCH